MENLFIINPAAGKHDRSAEIRREVEEVCARRGISCRVAVSQAPGDCCRIAREAAQTGREMRIFACGGDGTLNEVVNGAAGYPNVAVAHYAVGSGNDFVRIFGGDGASFRSLDTLLDGREETFDLVRCNDDYALNVCSVGFDARIGTQVAAYKRLPLITGSVAYLLSAAVNTVRGITERYVVEINGERIDSRQTMICVCNGQYYGGGFHPVPEADPGDGLLDVLVVGPVTRLQVLKVIGVYKAGHYRQLPQIVRHFRTRSLTIRCEKPTDINLDGELRRDQVVKISVAPVKLRFLLPRACRLVLTSPV